MSDDDGKLAIYILAEIKLQGDMSWSRDISFMKELKLFLV